MSLKLHLAGVLLVRTLEVTLLSKGKTELTGKLPQQQVGFLFFFAALGFEFRVSCLLDRCSYCLNHW
jgi:hypothetical protein